MTTMASAWTTIWPALAGSAASLCQALQESNGDVFTRDSVLIKTATPHTRIDRSSWQTKTNPATHIVACIRMQHAWIDLKSLNYYFKLFWHILFSILIVLVVLQRYGENAIAAAGRHGCRHQ